MKLIAIDFLRALWKGDDSSMYMSQREADGSTNIFAKLYFSLYRPRGDPRYTTRVVNFPPLHLLRSEPLERLPDHEYIHQSFLRLLWRERHFGHKASLLLYSTLYPLVFAVLCFWTTRLNGSYVKRQYGMSIVKQIVGQTISAFSSGILPLWYYTFELYMPHNMSRRNLYINRHEMKGGCYLMMHSAKDKMTMAQIGNKLVFNEICKSNQIPTPKTHFIVGESRNNRQHSLPKEDLFVKPYLAKGGEGAESYVFKGQIGRYISLRDESEYTEDELLNKIYSGNEILLVQSRLVNHPDIIDLSNGALSTVRMMTFEDEKGGYEVTQAGFRMATGLNRLVDNVHAGGIIAAIDLETGILGSASDLGTNPAVGWREIHPQTGGKIAGRVLPYWRETIEAAKRAHRAFAPRKVIGWDIAITPDGPSFLEGNIAPDTDILQRAHRAPLGDTRFARLVCHHIKSNGDLSKFL